MNLIHRCYFIDRLFALDSLDNLSPTHVGIAIAKSSHTYSNILRTKEFTINIPGSDIVKTIEILADNIPIEKSELDEAGLTAKDGIVIKTLSISECVVAVEFVFDKEVPIGHHNFVIGEVKGGWIKEEFLDSDGKIDIFKAQVFKDFKYPKPLYVVPGEVING
jgi:flavin reductase (DIM6/NTAB) family NADH-FMN oxidoreductase RutF